MITVEALLFAALGFLGAGLIAIAFLPLYRNRTARLTAARIRASMPVTELEISADRGLLRAQHAVALHDLESKLTRLQNTASTARVDINRRDAEIGALKRRLKDLEAELETNENARRVLERTIVDRVPNVERHLREAQAALAERDAEIDELRAQSTKSFRALDEALKISEQQRRDIERLTQQLEMRDAEAAEREEALTAGGGGQLARVGAELAALRTKVREQAALLGRYQEGGDGAVHGLPFENAAPDQLAQDARLKQVEGRLEDREREIKVLRAQLAGLEQTGGPGDAISRGDSAGGRRFAASASRLAALEVQAHEQDETIKRLRAELAAANERLARQAAHFMDELKRYRGPRASTGGRRSTAGAAVERLPQRLMDRVAEAGETPNAQGRAFMGEAAPAQPVNVDAVGASADSSAGGGDVERRTAAQAARENDAQQAAMPVAASAGRSLVSQAMPEAAAARDADQSGRGASVENSARLSGDPDERPVEQPPGAIGATWQQERDSRAPEAVSSQLVDPLRLTPDRDDRPGGGAGNADDRPAASAASRARRPRATSLLNAAADAALDDQVRAARAPDDRAGGVTHAGGGPGTSAAQPGARGADEADKEAAGTSEEGRSGDRRSGGLIARIADLDQK